MLKYVPFIALASLHLWLCWRIYIRTRDKKTVYGFGMVGCITGLAVVLSFFPTFEEHLTSWGAGGGTLWFPFLLMAVCGLAMGLLTLSLKLGVEAQGGPSC